MPEKKKQEVKDENVVMNSDEELIAVCGLDCGPCDIRKILTWSHDPDKAQRIVEWFHREGWLKEDEGIDEVIDKGCTVRDVKVIVLLTGHQTVKYLYVVLMRKTTSSVINVMIFLVDY